MKSMLNCLYCIRVYGNIKLYLDEIDRYTYKWHSTGSSLSANIKYRFSVFVLFYCFVNIIIWKLSFCFVTGGPGSGKVTHCDNLMQEKKGICHINMTDLLQQYAIGNGEFLL